MVALFGSLFILFGIPLVLQAYGPPLLVLGYLFGVNVVAGALFWRRAGRRRGAVGAAAIYLVSGVTLFSLMVEPVGIETMTVERVRIVAGLEEPPPPLRGELYRLAGTPAEQAALRRREGGRATWLDRLVLKVEAAMTRPDAR